MYMSTKKALNHYIHVLFFNCVLGVIHSKKILKKSMKSKFYKEQLKIAKVVLKHFSQLHNTEIQTHFHNSLLWVRVKHQLLIRKQK